MIALVWCGIALKTIDGFRSSRTEATTIQESFALVFEENVLRSIGEIDKALLYLRRMIENRIGRDELHEIVSTTDVLSEIIVQVAVIDAQGIMRASNAGPQPAKPIDLSDREHFRAHLNNGTDKLFISKPIIGRASNKWSVQLTRRFLMPDGSFGGVVVGSLNPDHFTKFFEQVQLGASVAVSLIGADNVVRSSGGNASGTFKLGEDVSGTPLGAAPGGQRATTFSAVLRGQDRIVTKRSVRGFPLTVVISTSAGEIYDRAWRSLERLAAFGVFLTAAIGFAMWHSAKAEDRRRSAELTVRRLAAQDALTGLANRRRLQEAMQACGATASAVPWALICIDLDRFKAVNDTLGHRIGDLLLADIAKRLSGLIPASATAARLGGDEFAILLPDVTSRETIDRTIAGLEEASARPYDLDGQSITCSLSVGVAHFPEHGQNAEDLLVSADLALYAAKRAGRNRVVYFDKSMNEEINRRRGVEVDLQRSLSVGDEIAVHYQPIFSADRHCLLGFEALARWHHPTKGIITPDIFIDVAEETGLIVPLGEWVLFQACHAAAKWPAHTKIAVNLSPAQFANADIPDMIARAVKASGLNPNRLEIEITESLLLKHDARTLDALARLRSAGIGVAMDDFGTGYSSLAYLKKFPLDKIKIDRSFIRDITKTQSARQIVDAIVRIAHAHGMVTTAEGVETEAQCEVLAALGCDQVQGFLFGRAETAEDCEQLFDSQALMREDAA